MLLDIVFKSGKTRCFDPILWIFSDDLPHRPVNSIAEKHVFQRWPSLACVSAVFAKPKRAGMEWKHGAPSSEKPQRKKTNKTHVDARKIM